MKKLRSFTMIELIVVITVILVLTGFTIYSLGPARAKSRDARRITDASLIMSALGQYHTSNLRTYPTPEVIPPDPIQSDQYYALELVDEDSFADLALSDYMPSPTFDPINNADYKYIYLYSGDGKKAAVLVKALESMDRCNTAESINNPEIVTAYLTDTLALGSGGEACYYVTQ